MANKTLFSNRQNQYPRADSRNEAGGRAYKFEPKHALAQLAATGTFNNVFYAAFVRCAGLGCLRGQRLGGWRRQ